MNDSSERVLYPVTRECYYVNCHQAHTLLDNDIWFETLPVDIDNEDQSHRFTHDVWCDGAYRHLRNLLKLIGLKDHVNRSLTATMWHLWNLYVICTVLHSFQQSPLQLTLTVKIRTFKTVLRSLVSPNVSSLTFRGLVVLLTDWIQVK